MKRALLIDKGKVIGGGADPAVQAKIKTAVNELIEGHTPTRYTVGNLTITLDDYFISLTGSINISVSGGIPTWTRIANTSYYGCALGNISGNILDLPEENTYYIIGASPAIPYGILVTSESSTFPSTLSLYSYTFAAYRNIIAVYSNGITYITYTASALPYARIYRFNNTNYTLDNATANISMYISTTVSRYLTVHVPDPVE